MLLLMGYLYDVCCDVVVDGIGEFEVTVKCHCGYCHVVIVGKVGEYTQ